MEMTSFDFQLLSRARNVPMMLTQLSRDIFLLKRIAGVPERVIRLREEWIDGGSRRLGGRPGWTRLQRETRLRWIDDRSRHHDHQSFDQVPQLTNIPRPVILLKHRHRLRRDLFHPQPLL